jgi:Zn-dependent protease
MLNYNLLEIIFRLMAFLFAISIHEYAHGAMANHLGDATAKSQGRLSLNPLAHLDLFGFLTLVLSGFRFGWAKPVPINPGFFKNPKRGMMYTGAAGPVANFVAAFCFSWTLKLVAISPVAGTQFGNLLYYFIYYNVLLNIGLGIFNLVPLPPLDGSRILMGLLPDRLAWRLGQLDRYGPLILIFLIWTGSLVKIINPFYQLMTRLLLP